MTPVQQMQKLQKNRVIGQRTTKKTKCRSFKYHVLQFFFHLITEGINSSAMGKHCMTVIQKVVHKVNPRQFPIFTTNQPIYTLLKQMQCKFSNGFGEDAFIIMMGGLHIGMAMLQVLGLILLGTNL